MAELLTEQRVKDLPPPERGNRIFYDAAERGLGLRITSAGARAYIFNYRTKGGTERRITIGTAGRWEDKVWRDGAWSLKAARKRAKELRQRIDVGEDPMGDLHAERAAPTVNDLADRFEKEHLPRKRPTTVDSYKRLLRVHIRPAIGTKKVADLRHADIEAMHRKIAAESPYSANRAAAVVSKMLSLAIKWEMRGDNPATGVERSPEHKRERYLTGAEIAKLSEALGAHSERVSANAVRLLLLTGARKGETLAAQWKDFDLEAGIWIKPAATTKTAKLHRVPLSAPAIALLVGMKAEADEEFEKERRDYPKAVQCPYVFPGSDGKPLTDIKHFWSSICIKAGLAKAVEKKDAAGRAVKDKDGNPVLTWQTTARIHDLRHTFASVLASSGLSLPVIGALLGHTQAATTARYAHLLDDPLRAAAERAAAVISAGGKKGADVVDLAERRA
ncbi:tyrosine-type recombinase/integrase [Acidisoma sp. 7E03]